VEPALLVVILRATRAAMITRRAGSTWCRPWKSQPPERCPDRCTRNLARERPTPSPRIARTNLRPFFDLFWDPGDSVQLGIGHRISNYDRIQAYTIFDVRLHTEQQNTHVLWRHKLNANNGITFDGVSRPGTAIPASSSGRWVLVFTMIGKMVLEALLRSTRELQ